MGPVVAGFGEVTETYLIATGREGFMGLVYLWFDCINWTVPRGTDHGDRPSEQLTRPFCDSVPTISTRNEGVGLS